MRSNGKPECSTLFLIQIDIELNSKSRIQNLHLELTITGLLFQPLDIQKIELGIVNEKYRFLWRYLI